VIKSILRPIKTSRLVAYIIA